MAKRGRKPKVQTEVPVVEVQPEVKAIEPVIEVQIETEKKFEKKAEPKKDEIILVKSENRYVIGKLIGKKAFVRHISGSGQPTSPKVWFIEATEKMLNELDAEEQEYIENAVYEEIDGLIDASERRKREEKATSGAQKRMPNAPVTPSQIY